LCWTDLALPPGSADRSRLFFLSSYGGHPDLHSFPTRRSSDLADGGRHRLRLLHHGTTQEGRGPGRLVAEHARPAIDDAALVGAVAVVKGIGGGVHAGALAVAYPIGRDVAGIANRQDRKSTRLNSSHVK